MNAGTLLAADALIAKLVAAVEERDRMLGLAISDMSWYDRQPMSDEEVIADLRARVACDHEEGK